MGPGIRVKLDQRAMGRLKEADPARAVEIIEDAASRADVLNPSAFVVRALATHPQKRSSEDMSASVLNALKRPRLPFGASSSQPTAAVEVSLDQGALDLLDAADP